MYIKSNGKRLAQHAAGDVQRYLSEKSRHTFIKDWQFQQIVVALKILFSDMVSVPWSGEFPWQGWIDAAQELGNDHATVARD